MEIMTWSEAVKAIALVSVLMIQGENFNEQKVNERLVRMSKSITDYY